MFLDLIQIDESERLKNLENRKICAPLKKRGKNSWTEKETVWLIINL